MKTINGDFLCYACKDPEGYAARLAQSYAKARQRWLEAHPVCKHCGRLLPQAFIDRGLAAHDTSRDECLISLVRELPLATRRAHHARHVTSPESGA